VHFRPRQQRRLCWSCSARAASTTLSTQSRYFCLSFVVVSSYFFFILCFGYLILCNFRGASTSRSVATRRAREPLSSKLMIKLVLCPQVVCPKLPLGMFYVILIVRYIRWEPLCFVCSWVVLLDKFGMIFVRDQMTNMFYSEPALFRFSYIASSWFWQNNNLISKVPPEAALLWWVFS